MQPRILLTEINIAIIYEFSNNLEIALVPYISTRLVDKAVLSAHFPDKTWVNSTYLM